MPAFIFGMTWPSDCDVVLSNLISLSKLSAGSAGSSSIMGLGSEVKVERIVLSKSGLGFTKMSSS